MKYGNYFHVDRYGITIIFNGRYFSLQKTYKPQSWERGPWQFFYWENIWKKTGIPIVN